MVLHPVLLGAVYLAMKVASMQPNKCTEVRLWGRRSWGKFIRWADDPGQRDNHEDTARPSLLNMLQASKLEPELCSWRPLFSWELGSGRNHTHLICDSSWWMYRTVAPASRPKPQTPTPSFSTPPGRACASQRRTTQLSDWTLCPGTHNFVWFLGSDALDWA